jgi:hypothetical protein
MPELGRTHRIESILSSTRVPRQIRAFGAKEVEVRVLLQVPPMIPRTVDGLIPGKDEPVRSRQGELPDHGGILFIATPRRLVLDLDGLGEPAAEPVRAEPPIGPRLEHPEMPRSAPPAPRGSCMTPWPSAAGSRSASASASAYAYAAAPQLVGARKKRSENHLFFAVLATMGFGLGVTVATFVARFLPHVIATH